MMKLILTTAALLVGAGMATAQHQPPPAASLDVPQPNAVVPETTGQAATFEDRWSAQRETPARPPATTDQAPQLKDAQPMLDQGNSSWSSPPVTAPTTQR
jgi:hypothetical protein